MGFKDILVHVRPHAVDGEPVQVALRLAAGHGARLTGLLTLRDLAMLKLLYPSSAAIVEQRVQEAARLATEVEDRLRTLADSAGVGFGFQVGEGDTAELLGLAGRYHDLVVIGQTDPGTEELGIDVPEAALGTCGRPVLVVPRQGTFPVVGRHVLVAWNGSRESARAVQAALPFIALAERITVLLGRSKERYPSITRRPPVDIAVHLARHAGPGCAPVEAVPLEVPEAEAGAAILRQAAARGADLLVMGAYGRSWLREWALGGATRHVLRNAPLPVLMAH
ncbi:universal stress protein [Rhodocista pekingensis]|uniref:Universal stress protein n=1 Tax=Rhodocista pekingensis TaxID=201185 RepID=A0ABW2L227_9PROT